jgi:hypothetical protein
MLYSPQYSLKVHSSHLIKLQAILLNSLLHYWRLYATLLKHYDPVLLLHIDLVNSIAPLIAFKAFRSTQSLFEEHQN